MRNNTSTIVSYSSHFPPLYDKTRRKQQAYQLEIESLSMHHRNPRHKDSRFQ
jgi:hypothetical protein